MPRSAKRVETTADYDEFNPWREGANAIGGVIARNPVAVGSATALIVAFSYVAANAVWYQPHFHKGAFFATRDVVNLEALPFEKPSETTIVIERPAPIPSPSDPIVERVQSVLRDLDFYYGDIDGLMGPATRKAIADYRGKVGLPAVDRIDDELLDHLGARQTTSAIVPKPAPRSVAVAPTPVEQPVEQVVVRPTPPVPAARVPATRVPEAAPGRPVADPQVMKIQAGLKAFGHQAMEVDGLMGAKTRAAIREFQSLFGLPETGEPDSAVLAKMRKEGLAN